MQVKDLKVGESIWREPYAHDHTKLRCEGKDGDFTIFSYKTYGGEIKKIKVKNGVELKEWTRDGSGFHLGGGHEDILSIED